METRPDSLKKKEGNIFFFFFLLESTSARSSPGSVVSAQSRNEHARPAFFQYFVAAEILPCFCEQALLVLENMVISGRTVRGIDAILAKKKA